MIELMSSVLYKAYSKAVTVDCSPARFVLSTATKKMSRLFFANPTAYVVLIRIESNSTLTPLCVLALIAILTFSSLINVLFTSHV